MRTVRHHIRKGVPLEHWARAWVGVSEALAQMERNPGHYHCVLRGERNDSLEETLRTRMNGAFPDSVKFQQDAGPCLQRTLYHVLLTGPHHSCGPTLLRIWDSLFKEGSKVTFQEALTLNKQHQVLILKVNSVSDISRSPEGAS
ncbi:hypothetical protein JEQ12_007953 [Ovis aries]|uniref:Uncharacterized protein n=1 Tax=Ovis aries TaxID=9940 RepID=A0A836CUQ9_SHEEP|nr:hypothetical protein JEQ12_007953 [Ovis aries]